MSSSHHQQSRSKTSHKNRRKENDLQNLCRQNKSAFPEQMEERDIQVLYYFILGLKDVCQANYQKIGDDKL